MLLITNCKGRVFTYLFSTIASNGNVTSSPIAVRGTVKVPVCKLLSRCCCPNDVVMVLRYWSTL